MEKVGIPDGPPPARGGVGRKILLEAGRFRAGNNGKTSAGQGQRGQTNLEHNTDLSIRGALLPGLMIERPARDLKTKSLQTPAKRRMKAFSESFRAHARQAGLILLFDGEVGRHRIARN
jgi:hypothetical protein